MLGCAVAQMLEKLGTSENDMKLKIIIRNKDAKAADERAKDAEKLTAIIKSNKTAVSALHPLPKPIASPLYSD